MATPGLRLLRQHSTWRSHCSCSSAAGSSRSSAAGSSRGGAAGDSRSSAAGRRWSSAAGSKSFCGGGAGPPRCCFLLLQQLRRRKQRHRGLQHFQQQHAPHTHTPGQQQQKEHRRGYCDCCRSTERSAVLLQQKPPLHIPRQQLRRGQGLPHAPTQQWHHVSGRPQQRQQAPQGTQTQQKNAVDEQRLQLQMQQHAQQVCRLQLLPGALTAGVVQLCGRGQRLLPSTWMSFTHQRLRRSSSSGTLSYCSCSDSHSPQSSSNRSNGSHTRDARHGGRSHRCSDSGSGRNSSNIGDGRRTNDSNTHNSNNAGVSRNGSSSRRSTSQRVDYRMQQLFLSCIPSFTCGKGKYTSRPSLSSQQLRTGLCIKRPTAGSVGGTRAAFSSSAAAAAAATATAAATGTEGTAAQTPVESVRGSKPRQEKETGDDGRRRDAALLQLVLPRRLRMAFPYVVPAFRPLVLLAALPVEQQILSERSSALRLAAARRGHALLPPFSPQTEELWCTYTRWMLTDPAVALRQQLEKSGDKERRTERGSQPSTTAGVALVEPRKGRAAVSSVLTDTSEGSLTRSPAADAAGETGEGRSGSEAAATAVVRYGGRRPLAAAGKEGGNGEGRSARTVRVTVFVGELLGQLLATRNVTLQAPWKLLFAAVEPSLLRLQQQQQKHKTQIASATVRQTGSSAEDGSAADTRSSSSSSSSEGSGGSRDFLEVTLRLRSAASRVRFEWKWGVRQIEEAARKDFPLFEKDRALKVLHALSSSAQVEDRLCERLADAFVFLWRSDYAEATRMQPTEGLLLLDTLSQRKQLLQALPDPFFFKHVCRRLHSYLHLGLLTPWEKTRLCDFYKQMRMRHFTFFSHLAAELLQQQQTRQNLLAAGQARTAALPTADELQQQQQQARRLRLAKLQQQLLLGPAVASAASAAAAKPAATTTKTGARAGTAAAGGTGAAGGEQEKEPDDATAGTRAAPAARDSMTAATAAGEKEWKYLEYSRRDYVMGCGLALDFAPSGVLLEQPLLPMLTIGTVKRLRRGEFGCHLNSNSSRSGSTEHEEGEDETAEAAAEDEETFERTDLPHQGIAAPVTTATAAATRVATSSAAAPHTAATGEGAGEGIREYTAGQMAVIADAMLFLNMHHETCFADSVLAAVGGRFSAEHALVDSLDPQQCASVMVCFGESKHRLPEDSRLLQLLTNRFVDMTVAEIASPAQCVLFFQALVKWTTRKVIERHERKPQWKQRRNSYISLDWLHAPPPRLGGSLSPTPSSSESLLLLLCKHVCRRVHSFSMRELTRILRAIAYLNFPEEPFFRTFSDFCIQRLGEMGEEDIANMTQAFNRAGVEDPYLFSMMGKRHQQLQAKLMAFKHRGVLVRRIG